MIQKITNYQTSILRFSKLTKHFAGLEEKTTDKSPLFFVILTINFIPDI